MQTAKYIQVIDWIKAQIASGEVKGGEKLESENQLSARFGISRQTVRHALDLLVQEDILERVHGSGTYVRKNRHTMVDRRLSHHVTILSTYVDAYIFPRILKSMAGVLEQAGYGVRIIFTNNHLETERRELIRLLEEDCRDPLIVEPVMSGLPNPNLQYYRQLQARGIPVLFFHSFYPELDAPHVCMDDEAAGRLATEYLIQRGHRRIGGVFKADDGQGRLRYQGYLTALMEAGIEIDEERICWIDSREMKNLSYMRPKICERLQHCTAWVCYNDELAHDLTEFLLQKGERIPEDISITSIDNSELAKLNAVPLTSVTNPMEALGVKTAENMLQLIRDPDFDATFLFPVDIEERCSAATIEA